MKNLVAPESLVEFQKKPVQFDKIVAYLEAHPEVTAATMCKLIGVPVQGLYNWRNEFRKRSLAAADIDSSGFSVLPVSGSGKYSAADKFALMKQYDKVEGQDRTELLRKYAIYQADIKRWRETANQAVIESLGKRKTRSDKQPAEAKLIESLKKDLQDRDKRIEKLETLVMIQKKLSLLLESNESP